MIKIKQKSLLTLAAAIITTSFQAQVTAAELYDLVINQGRVMDPETRYDATANVGIKDGRIVIITNHKINGIKTINAQGLVVAPGFIDAHTHGIDRFAIKAALRDGVTTAMDLEAGAVNVADWYEQKNNRWQINYGTTVNHSLVRMMVHDPEVTFDQPVDFPVIAAYLQKAGADGVSGWSTKRSSGKQLNFISQRIDKELQAGALGVGITAAYVARGASSYEIFEVQRAAARYGRLSAVHTRYHQDSQSPTEAPIAFDEIFTNASLLKAPLLMVHNNGYGWEEIAEKLQLARDQGMNMWSEQYPYSAGSTFVAAEDLRPEIFEDKNGYQYKKNLYDPIKDRFLDRTSYQKLVTSNPGQTVIIFMNKRKQWLPYWLMLPHVTVGSDGMAGVGADGKLLPWEAKYSEYLGHPRTIGARAKTLRLGREFGIPLMHSLAQLSYWSAKHLGDAGLEAMQQRGRMQAGMIADITIFNAATVSDHADYSAGTNGLPSTGIPWVIVNGNIVVKNSRVLKDVNPGQPIRYPIESQGRYQPISSKQWLSDFTILNQPLPGRKNLSHLPQ